MDALRHIDEGIQGNGVCLVIGMEYDTPDGHFLVFGPFEKIPAGLSARELLTTVRSEGGAVIAAHPFRTNKSTQEYVLRENLCNVVEAVNGRNTISENVQIEIWRNKYVFSECCGSDAHSIEELGRATTRFDMPIRSRGDLVFALNNGLFSPNGYFASDPLRQSAQKVQPIFILPEG